MYMNLLLKSQIFFLIEHRITSDSLCFKSQANDKRTHQHHSNQEETARKKECSIGRTPCNWGRNQGWILRTARFLVARTPLLY